MGASHQRVHDLVRHAVGQDLVRGPHFQAALTARRSQVGHISDAGRGVRVDGGRSSLLLAWTFDRCVGYIYISNVSDEDDSAMSLLQLPYILACVLIPRDCAEQENIPCDTSASCGAGVVPCCFTLLQLLFVVPESLSACITSHDCSRMSVSEAKRHTHQTSNTLYNVSSSFYL